MHPVKEFLKSNGIPLRRLADHLVILPGSLSRHLNYNISLPGPDAIRLAHFMEDPFAQAALRMTVCSPDAESDIKADTTDYSKRLIAFLNRFNLQQKQAARIFSVKRSTISMWVTGNAKMSAFHVEQMQKFNMNLQVVKNRRHAHAAFTEFYRRYKLLIPMRPKEDRLLFAWVDYDQTKVGMVVSANRHHLLKDAFYAAQQALIDWDADTANTSLYKVYHAARIEGERVLHFAHREVTRSIIKRKAEELAAAGYVLPEGAVIIIENGEAVIDLTP